MSNKAFNIAIVSLILILASSLGMLAYETKKFLSVKPRLNPIVRLSAEGRTFCSGTVVNEHTIITAAHCVVVQTPSGAFLNKEPIEIRAEDNKARGTTGVVIYATPRMDQAVLTGDFKIFEPKTLIDSVEELAKLRNPKQKFISCGYPLGGGLYCSPMTFVNPMGFQLAVKGVLLPGMSGGPMMLEDGRVVGINTAVDETDSIFSPAYNLHVYFDDKQ